MDSAFCLFNANIFTGFSVMSRCAIYIKNGKIIDIFSEERFRDEKFPKEVKVIDVNGAYVLPGFIDSHIHGIGGYGADDGDAQSIINMSKILAEYGVTSFIPTCNTQSEEKLIKNIKAIVSAMGKENGARILGLHLEGPFLSPKRIGAQIAEDISPIDLEYMKRLYEVSEGHLINMTVAPELSGIEKLAAYCNEKGVVMQIGHSDASYNQVQEAMMHNIRHITHLFNAMRPMHHREPGVVGATLIHSELSCEIIGDGVHVDSNLVNLLLKCKPLSQIVMITDSLYPAKTDLSSAPDLYLNKCFYRKKDNVMNGSAISMLDGFRNLVSWGIPIEKAVRMTSTNPAQIMKQKQIGLLIPGNDADIIVLDKNLDLIYTIIQGKFVKGKI